MLSYMNGCIRGSAINDSYMASVHLQAVKATELYDYGVPRWFMQSPSSQNKFNLKAFTTNPRIPRRLGSLFSVKGSGVLSDLVRIVTLEYGQSLWGAKPRLPNGHTSVVDRNGQLWLGPAGRYASSLTPSLLQKAGNATIETRQAQLFILLIVPAFIMHARRYMRANSRGALRKTLKEWREVDNASPVRRKRGCGFVYITISLATTHFMWKKIDHNLG
ncbi:hypothetical protein CPB86DRAFT_800824 [Serendipita vermifera]|nr:hypothetical protein CPB86DRAFT_800824 [Serendipita vermifera]